MKRELKKSGNGKETEKGRKKGIEKERGKHGNWMDKGKAKEEKRKDKEMAEMRKEKAKEK